MKFALTSLFRSSSMGMMNHSSYGKRSSSILSKCTFPMFEMLHADATPFRLTDCPPFYTQSFATSVPLRVSCFHGQEPYLSQSWTCAEKERRLPVP